METPMIEPVRTKMSGHFFCMLALITPAGMPMITAKNMATKISSRVAGRRVTISWSTGRLVPMEVPRSPRSRDFM